MENKIKPKSKFNRNVITLVTGTTIAQVIPIAISPILTRIYTPESFGLFALYMSILMIFSGLVSGRYELAILIPKNSSDAKHIVVFSIILSFLMSFILFILFIVFSNRIVSVLNNNEILSWLYMLPLNVFIMSTVSILFCWNNRVRNYKNLSNNQVIKGTVQGFSNVVIGSIAKIEGGLILGTFLGSLTSILYLITKTKYDFRGFKPRKLKSLALLKKYIKFPKYMVPSGLLEGMSMQLPVFFLGSFFGSSVVGFYSLSQRIIRLPVMLIGASIASVFRQEASFHLAGEGSCRSIFERTFKKLFLMATIPFILFYFVAPELFRFVFGKEWEVAGNYVQILMPMFYLQFIVSPLSGMFMLAEKQQYDLYMQVYLVIGVLLAFIVGYKCFDSVEISLGIYSFAYSLKYIFELTMSYKFTVKVGR